MIKLKSIDGSTYVEGRRITNDDGTPTPYIVTEDGQIYSNESNAYRKLDKPNNSGYIMISLSINGEWKKLLVHRIVAKYYLSNPYNFPCVNHKDCDPTNNHYTNLEHCTYEYNSSYSTSVGNGRPELHRNRSKLSADDIRKICEYIVAGYKNIAIARMFNVNKSYIANIKGRACHTDISKDFDFGDNYVYYGDNLVGNEGNEYIPPLEVDPEWISKTDPRYIRKICEALSGYDYLSNQRAGYLFGVNPNTIKKIRNGEIYTDIVSEYEINNDTDTIKKTYLSDLSRDETIEIMKMLSKYKINAVSAITGISRKSLEKLTYSDEYELLRDELGFVYVKSKKGTPLTDEQIIKTIELIKLDVYTRETIAKKVGISVPSVCKIKRNYKKGKYDNYFI